MSKGVKMANVESSEKSKFLSVQRGQGMVVPDRNDNGDIFNK